MQSLPYDTRLRDLPAEALHEILLRISRIDRFRGWWEGQSRLPPSLLGRLKKRVVGTSAGVIVSPGGALRGRPIRVPGSSPTGRGNTPSPRQAGYAALLRSVFDGHREMTFGEELILRFHADLLRYSPADRSHRGKYRTLPVGPSPRGTLRPESPALRPADPARAAAEMGNLIRWTAENLDSRTYHPLLVIPSFLLELLAIRPFASGNGRISRILANFLLLRCGYDYIPYRSLEQAIADRRTEYLLSLRRSQALRNVPRPDISAWLRIFLEVLEAQAVELRNLVSGSPGFDLLSANQLSVLELLERTREVSTGVVSRELGIPRDTAKQVLGRLVELSLVKRTGAGRATRYRKAPLPQGQKPDQ